MGMGCHAGENPEACKTCWGRKQMDQKSPGGCCNAPQRLGKDPHLPLPPPNLPPAAWGKREAGTVAGSGCLSEARRDPRGSPAWGGGQR